MLQTDVSDPNQCQLKMLGEISQILSALNIGTLVAWRLAIAFLLGRIPRPHKDIDIVVWDPAAHHPVSKQIMGMCRNQPPNLRFLSNSAEYAR